MSGLVRIVLDLVELDRLRRDIEGSPFVRILHDGVEYGIYQEFGFTSRSGNAVPAQPFMTPAVLDAEASLREAFRGVGDLRQADLVVQKVAYDAEREAKSLAPVDTGALKNSIEVSTPEEMPELGIDFARVGS